MPFQVIHPTQFPARFGVAKTPSKSTLKRWRNAHGFPSALEIPRGHYKLDEVETWFKSRAA